MGVKILSFVVKVFIGFHYLRLLEEKRLDLLLLELTDSLVQQGVPFLNQK
ncbi:hypothetical protein HDC33_000502 [Sporosarcina sp. JAI121]|nr:hypothetical protein [Sporosarcina sp. JAI121]